MTQVIDAAAQPASACLTCHAAAYVAWSRSAHARAWASLGTADQVDDCVGCHSTPVINQGKASLALNVSCQSCHRGSDAHAANPTVKTTGATDCRSCHDARHDPAFQHEAAWTAITHGK